MTHHPHEAADEECRIMRTVRIILCVVGACVLGLINLMIQEPALRAMWEWIKTL